MHLRPLLRIDIMSFNLTHISASFLKLRIQGGPWIFLLFLCFSNLEVRLGDGEMKESLFILI